MKEGRGAEEREKRVNRKEEVKKDKRWREYSEAESDKNESDSQDGRYTPKIRETERERHTKDM